MTRTHVVVGIALLDAALHFVTGPRYAGPFRPLVTGYLQDVLVPMTFFLLLGVNPPRRLAPQAIRGLLVFGAAAAVEGLQSLGVPLLGRTFDPLDFAAYAAGVGVGIVLERRVLSRLPDTRG